MPYFPRARDPPFLLNGGETVWSKQSAELRDAAASAPTQVVRTAPSGVDPRSLLVKSKFTGPAGHVGVAGVETAIVLGGN